MNNELTQQYIQSLFTYRDGELYWKKRNGNKAGTLNKVTRYYSIKINNKLYRTHRLIFLFYNNYLPKEIDHIDLNKQNNNIENLREVTRSQNEMNRKSYKNSSSKYKGVCWHKASNKWITQIQINGKKKYLGVFINEIDAAKIYNEVAIKYFGEFANLNEVE